MVHFKKLKISNKNVKYIDYGDLVQLLFLFLTLFKCFSKLLIEKNILTHHNLFLFFTLMQLTKIITLKLFIYPQQVTTWRLYFHYQYSNKFHINCIVLKVSTLNINYIFQLSRSYTLSHSFSLSICLYEFSFRVFFLICKNWLFQLSKVWHEINFSSIYVSLKYFQLYLMTFEKFPKHKTYVVIQKLLT